MRLANMSISRKFYLTACVILLGLCNIVLILLKVVPSGQKIELVIRKPKCYQYPNYSTNTRFLDDILTAKMKPIDKRSIFFLITTCSKDDAINLNARQSCAIESAALHNPNRRILVLFASPVDLQTNSHSSSVAALQLYANIQFLSINLETIVEETPAKEFYRSGVLFTSNYLVQHMSDFLRLIILYKFGGIYLDTDVVVQKNLNELPANFLGKEAYDGYSVSSVNGAVLGFQDEIGHEILKLCLNEFVNHFKPKEWGYNGPKLLTRVLENQVCHTSLANMTPDKCNGFNIFAANEFYPVNYDNWEQLFNADATKKILRMIKNSSVVHIWNNLSHEKLIQQSNSKSAYEVIAEKNCPTVFNTFGL